MKYAIAVCLHRAQDQKAWRLVRDGWLAYADRCQATLIECETEPREHQPSRCIGLVKAWERGFDQVLLIDPWIRVSAHAPSIFATEGRVSRSVFDRGAALEGVRLVASPGHADAAAVGPAPPLDPRFNVSWRRERRERFPFLLSCPGHSWAPQCVGRSLETGYFLNFAGAEADLGIEPRAARPEKRRIESATARIGTRPAVRAVALFLYNRPDLTAQVFKAIRAARPAQLFLVADGPDLARAGDEVACKAARDCLDVDWKCEVFRDFSAHHQGARPRVETGFKTVFGRVEEAILLEDDLLPSPDFFEFCEELLDRHRRDERVLSISGSALHFGLVETNESYVFARYPNSWGWATWRRAIEKYDPARRYPEPYPDALRWLQNHLASPDAAAYWAHLFEASRPGPTWDAIWTRSGFLAGGLHAVPMRNLVSNLGFRPDATHTRARSPFSDLPTEPIGFPLTEPVVQPCVEVDAFLEETVYSGNLTRARASIRERVAARRRGRAE